MSLTTINLQMAMEYETAVSDDANSMSRRIDELLASAIEDQAREQRMMIETVTGARKALAAAQSDLSAIRTLIESRDQTVVDMLEARLAGIASQQGIDEISRRLEPVQHAAEELAARLERIVDPLDGVRVAVGALTEGMDALREQSKHEFAQLGERSQQLEARLGERSEHLETRLNERSHQFETKLKESMEVQEQAIAGKLAMSSNSLAERIEDKQERFRSQLTEILEAAIAELRGTTEEILRSTGATTEEMLRASDETIRQELRQELQNFSARTFDRIQKLREDIGGYEKMIQDLPMLVDEHLVAHREAAQAADSATSRQLESMRKTISEMEVTASTRFDRIDREMAARLAEVGVLLQKSVEESVVTFDQGLETFVEGLDSRLEKVVQTVSAQAPALAETVGSILQPFVDEMAKMAERVRQTNRRMTESNARMEAMHESLIAYLSQRDEQAERTRDTVLGELIEHMAVQLGRKDRLRIADAFRDAEQRRKDRRDAERYRKSTKKNKGDAVKNLEEIAAEMEAAPMAEAEPPSIDLAAAETESSSEPDPAASGRKKAGAQSRPKSQKKKKSPSKSHTRPV